MQINKSLLLRPAQPIQDKEISSFLAQCDLSGMQSWLDNKESLDVFFETARIWIRDFQHSNDFSSFRLQLCSGTTESFVNFYMIHQNRTLKILKGEYPFHRDVFDKLSRPWDWLSRDTLTSQDAVIISYPFSGSGNAPSDFTDILQRCEELGIPVLIDCAFAGLSGLVLPKIDHFQCVQTISFSLSKVFNYGHFRCGFEFTRGPGGFTGILTEWDYGPKAATFWGQKLMSQFPLHTIYRKYRNHQIQVCKALGLTPSDTVLFGLGDQAWSDFARDKTFNRVCLSEVLTVSS